MVCLEVQLNSSTRLGLENQGVRCECRGLNLPAVGYRIYIFGDFLEACGDRCGITELHEAYQYFCDTLAFSVPRGGLGG